MINSNTQYVYKASDNSGFVIFNQYSGETTFTPELTVDDTMVFVNAPKNDLNSAN